MVQRAEVKHQASDVFYRQSTSRADETAIDDEIPLLSPEKYAPVKRDDNPTEHNTLRMNCEWKGNSPLKHGHGKLMTINDDERHPTVPSTAEFLAAQENDRICHQIASNIITPGLIIRKTDRDS